MENGALGNLGHLALCPVELELRYFKFPHYYSTTTNTTATTTNYFKFDKVQEPC